MQKLDQNNIYYSRRSLITQPRLWEAFHFLY